MVGLMVAVQAEIIWRRAQAMGAINTGTNHDQLLTSSAHPAAPADCGCRRRL